MHTKTRNDINFSWIVSVALLIVVDSLEFILFLLVQVTHLSQNFGVRGDLGDQNIVPFESLASHTDQLIDVGNLVDDFVAVRDDGVQFLECLERLVIVAESLVHQT